MRHAPSACLITLFALLSLLARAATYYVDFDGGLDSNDGSAAASAFKHSPGDTAATDKAAATQIQAGDTVIFKGGVRYRGSVTVGASGDKDKPIILDGNTAGTFGTGAAIIEGAEPIGGWKPCASADDAMGNSNWQKLFYTDQVPAGINIWSAGPYENDLPLYLEETPTASSDLFWWDIYQKAVPVTQLPAADPSNPGGETLTDADFFTQTDPHAWDGAYITLHGNPNLFYPAPVTAYDPSAHRISFKQPKPVKYYSLGSKLTYFFMLNALPMLDKPGQYTLTPMNGAMRIFCWPNNPATFPNSASIAARSRGFVLSGGYITVRGFILQHFSEINGKGPIGIEGTGSNLTLQNNEVRWLRDRYSDRSPAVSLSKSNDSAVIGNNVHDNIKSVGTLFYFCNGDTYKDNTLHRNGDTAADFYGCKTTEVTHNKLSESLGMHANGLTFYVGCSDIKIEGNYVVAIRPLTFSNAENFRIVNNVFDAMGQGSGISTWPGTVNHVLVEFNTLVKAKKGDSYSGGIANLELRPQDYVARNNILDSVGGPGAGAVSLDTNLILGTGGADPTQVFVDYDKGDYHLKSGSPAIGMGKPSDIKTDFEGNPRPDGKNPDVGAYQFQPGKN